MIHQRHAGRRQEESASEGAEEASLHTQVNTTDRNFWSSAMALSWFLLDIGDQRFLDKTMYDIITRGS
ncbi:unnamed protein product [Knipowitschia caucasica]|uniref:Uncharacterized protein n=1 Tax=Knipowitschia caucasica TaxID=637954 RepID=A0AAV2MAI3_KNICA